MGSQLCFASQHLYRPQEDCGEPYSSPVPSLRFQGGHETVGSGGCYIVISYTQVFYTLWLLQWLVIFSGRRHYYSFFKTAEFVKHTYTTNTTSTGGSSYVKYITTGYILS